MYFQYYSGTSLNGHSVLRTPHYTGQNVAVRIEFALRVILNSVKWTDFAVPLVPGLKIHSIMQMLVGLFHKTVRHRRFHCIILMFQYTKVLCPTKYDK